jgi:hypothetical protein
VHDALLVGVPDDQRARCLALDRLEHLLEHDDVAGALEPARLDDVHRLVEHDLLAVLEVVDLHRRGDRDTQLAAAGEDVDRAVVVTGEEDAVARRWLAEPVDLLLERDQLLTRVAQRAGELVVALGQERRTALRLRHALLEQPQLAGALRHLAAQQADLLLQVGDLAEQRRHVTLAPRSELVGTIAKTGAHRAPPTHRESQDANLYTRGDSVPGARGRRTHLAGSARAPAAGRVSASAPGAAAPGRRRPRPAAAR